MGGLFGGMKLPAMPGVISGYGGGTWNMDGTQATPMDRVDGVPMGDFGPRPDGIDKAAAYTGPVKKGGLFGSGIKWHQILGALSDGVLAANGQGMPYASMITQQRQQDNQLKRLAAQQQAELQQQMALYDYKRANPMPQNDSFTRAMKQAGYVEGTPEWQALAKKRAEMMTNPVQLVQDGFGGVQPYRPYDDGDVPEGPVGPLTPYNGGPMPSASGGFPR